MPARPLVAAAALATLALFALVALLIWQPWKSDESDSASDQPRMTLEGVIALVSAEHVGCPEQPAIVLTADVTYDGSGKWIVTYGEYSWVVDEADKSVRAIDEPLPCPER